jgi:hypothetical protein
MHYFEKKDESFQGIIFPQGCKHLLSHPLGIAPELNTAAAFVQQRADVRHFRLIKKSFAHKVMPEVNDDGPGIFLPCGSHRLPAMRERSAQQYEVIGEIIAHMGAHITLSAATNDPGQLIFRMEMIGRKEAGFLEFPDKEG